MIPLPEWFPQALPLVATLGLVVIGLWALKRWHERHPPSGQDAHLPRQMALVAAHIVAGVLILLSLPVSETTRGQIFSLTGLIVTALIALSSTSFVANAMAGLLLRIIDSYRPGDFIRVGDHFGRVSERGLFHTEIQTEDRDLMTLPNMQVITTPVTVVHATGTIVSATLSLGYEVHHRQVEAELVKAATACGLTDPFVQLRELGDFSVVYRIGGRLDDVGSLLTARSNLRCEVLDALHAAGIEIVSPNFMNQRVQSPEQQMIPRDWHPPKVRGEQDPKVEDMLFDKAEQAGQQEQRLLQIETLRKQLQALKDQSDAGAEQAIAAAETQLGLLEAEHAEQQQSLAENGRSGEVAPPIPPPAKESNA